MDNQHQKITGYRDLTQEEIDLMNRIKQHAADTKALIADVQQHLALSDPLPHETDLAMIPMRWTHIAQTELQQGFMALNRAVARPSSF
jgi:hypothetical protein